MALRSWLKDIVVIAAVLAVLLAGLYAYAQTWPPAVIVESGSMMHQECSGGLTPPACDTSVTYGRIGTIDPGDLVLVKHVASPDAIVTLAEGGRSTYGKAGDVIIYYPANLRSGTPIIHRAVAYLVVTGSGDATQYWVRWSDAGACEGGATKLMRGQARASDPAFDGRDAHAWCVYDNRGVLIPSIPIGTNRRPFVPARTGFFTKGDNPATNFMTDQAASPPIARDANGLPSPVPMEWIEGKARGELPWLGLLKLALAGHPNEQNPPAAWVKVGSAYAPKDLWVMLGITLGVLVGIPLLYDGSKAIRTRRVGSADPPGVPRNLAGTSPAADRIALAWEAPATGAPPASYHVYRGQTRIGTTREPRHLDEGLVPGATYLYAVSAVDATGKEGARTSHVHVATRGEA